jgi:nicotinamidase/pyrazinamidase
MPTQTELYVVGLATDYCVKFTALDARSLGYDVKIVIDGTRGVDMPPGTAETALMEMQGAGCIVVDSHDVLKELGVEVL